MQEAAKPSLADIQMQAVYLTALIEGLSVLVYAADGDKKNPDTRRASNCIGPMAEDLAEHAQRIATDLEEHT